MLKIWFMAAFGLAVSGANAQSIADLTEELALDAQKLSSMKATLQEMYQGYTELASGYTRIRDVVKNNFNLHEVYLDALWVVSPAVRNDPRMQEIITTMNRIVDVYEAAMGRSSGAWTAGELSFITGTFALLLQRSLQEVDELTMITTDNELRMNDAERLQALGRIDTEVKSELSFMERFDQELRIEAARRGQESNDINTLKSIYGLPN
jgi:hypothetical protein